MDVARGISRRRWELKQLRDGGGSIRSGSGGGRRGGGGGGRNRCRMWNGQSHAVARDGGGKTDKARLTENQYKNALLKKKPRPHKMHTPIHNVTHLH